MENFIYIFAAVFLAVCLFLIFRVIKVKKVLNGKIKILQFENEPILAELYRKKLEQEGFECKNYENPSKNPIEIILREKPNIIIMDIIMPVMDGFKATEIIKNDERTKKIPIIGFTNLGMPSDIKKGIDLGMSDYLIKADFTPKEFIDSVKEYLKDPIHYKPKYEIRLNKETL